MRTAGMSWRFVAFTLLLSAPSGAFASSQSLLDPYASVQAPPGTKSKTAKPKPLEGVKIEGAKKSALEKSDFYGNSSSEDIVQSNKSVSGSKNSRTNINADKSKTVAATKKVDNASSEGAGVKSGLKEIQNGYFHALKAASTGLVSKTKTAGSKMADSTKVIRAKVSTGTKSSREYLAKGANAVGHGFKVTGEKIRSSAGVVKDKVANVPQVIGKSFKNLKGSPNQPKEENLPKFADASAKGKKIASATDPALAGKPLAPLSPVKHGGVFGRSKAVVSRTFGKLNPFNRDGRSNQSNSATAVVPAHSTENSGQVY